MRENDRGRCGEKQEDSPEDQKKKKSRGKKGCCSGRKGKRTKELGGKRVGSPRTSVGEHRKRQRVEGKKLVKRCAVALTRPDSGSDRAKRKKKWGKGGGLRG